MSRFKMERYLIMGKDGGYHIYFDDVMSSCIFVAATFLCGVFCV